MTVGIGSTREEILYLLKNRPYLSVGEIAQELGITEMAVRRHLNNLERDHYLSSHLVRQSMGRPSRVYFLTEKADDLFPKAYPTFALEIIEDLEALKGPEAVQQLFARREERLYQQYQDHVSGEDLDEKVQQLAGLQDKKGYMVKWEKQGEQYVIKEYNCPIARIAKQFPLACQNEVSLFERLLGRPVQQVQCIAQGATHCMFTFSAHPGK
ncbi:MAG: hypothetical protein BAA01_06760 [Bacillus thermozeamaize]|mgnify:CR=1 FL=1|uniref:HTH deoR-type domain-containing protein n=1 Tax=Bacillus thermozeamaize TaxID=230954 RepID=A0A1Y3PGH2_9BACI|nr:MAG: hypothetical protein BAA01_06760 [Bacillus thermozeamaize]